jgi:hypothetical protein
MPFIASLALFAALRAQDSSLPKPRTKTLCSVAFDRDRRCPVRADNEAKACLDDVGLNAQQQTDAKLVIVGESAPNERGREFAAHRAVNVKHYLVEDKGIDASRIEVRTGTQDAKEVEDYLVPAHGDFDADVPGTQRVDEDSVKWRPCHAKGLDSQ